MTDHKHKREKPEGNCLWCANPLPKRRRKYCGDWHGYLYWREYVQPLLWLNARGVAMQRAGRVCEDCGGRENLEVHHIIRLEPGEARLRSPKNEQSNLRVLCRPCHERAHHPPKEPSAPVSELQGTLI